MPLYESVSEKIAVVFDFGKAYTKCGFAGENGPRCIIPSEIKRQKSGKLFRLRDNLSDQELYDGLVDFVHFLYFRELLVNPKERKVVIVESVLSTTKFRNVLGRVFFKHFEVPSVLFGPSHVMALFTLGLPSALVLDCGYSETVVLPVYEAMPLINACEALPVAGHSIHQYLEAQLREHATVRTSTGDNVSFSSAVDVLNESVLEDIKVRACFVMKMERAQQIKLARKDQSTSGPTPPPSIEYPLNGTALVQINGSIRENACEVLFERDADEMSVATLVLDSILKCPIDTRRTLAENILLIGGTSMLPGFKHRLLMELLNLVKTPKYEQRMAISNFKFHSPPAKENYAAWLGGAIFGALDVIAARSLSRDQYLQFGKVPDWCCLTDLEEHDVKGSAMNKDSSLSIKTEAK